MAGPEGFDASLIETEALLKRMKPRPANVSAARIVYEAGRAVGKEEMQAQLVSGGLVLAAPPVASWKKWIVPSWAAGTTAVCVLLCILFANRGPQIQQPDFHRPQVTVQPGSYQGDPYSRYGKPLDRDALERQAVETQIASEQPFAAPDQGEIAPVLTPASNPQIRHTQASSTSDNESGVPREVPPKGQQKPREKNLAEYLREQLPSIESRRNFDPLEMPNGGAQPPGGGMALTALGFIKTP